MRPASLNEVQFPKELRPGAVEMAEAKRLSPQ